MFSWFDDILLGRDRSALKFKEEHRTVIDTEIYDMKLASTKIVTRHNFSSYMLEEGVDSMVILYTTGAVNDVQRNMV